MKRREFLEYSIKSCLAGCLFSDTILNAMQISNIVKRPNFIVIMADDLGWGDLACYGHPRIKTPNIDKLAKEGTLFTNFYCNAAICSPTRAAMMTGKFPARVGVHAQISTKKQMEKLDSAYFLDPKYETLPRLLQKNGYTTLHSGKWHLAGWLHQDASLPCPDKYGFDEYRVRYLSWPDWKDSTYIPHSTELFVDEGIKMIEARDVNKPFYLQLWLTDPHEPIMPEEDQTHCYDDIKPGRPYDKQPDREPQRMYWSVVTEMDKQIGKLIKKIDELGIREDTYIIFTSDNGAALSSSYDIYVGMGSNGPFRGQKGSLYEGGIRTPFIISKPGTVPSGKVDHESIISGVDFLPTFCKLAEVALPDSLELDGENISSCLNGNPDIRSKPLMWQWRFAQARETLHKSPMLAIRENKWKLLINPDMSRVELYDIKKNPEETDNLADKYPEIVKNMSKQLLEFHKSLPEGIMDTHAGSNDYPWPN